MLRVSSRQGAKSVHFWIKSGIACLLSQQHGKVQKWAPTIIAVMMGALIAVELAPDRGGPGITCDEWYHVFQGKRLIRALAEQGFEFFSPEKIKENFPWSEEGAPFHPPLGHWVIGCVHAVFDLYPQEPAVVAIVPARLMGPGVFIVLLLCLGHWLAKREGTWEACVGVFAVALMPRVFGHAHLVELDLLTACVYLAALVSLAEAAQSDRRLWQFAIAGIVAGLCLLTRLHGVLLAPPVLIWLVARDRIRGLYAFTVWGLTAGVTFFVGWPWLWLNPWQNFWTFLGTGTERPPINVFYLGRTWLDRELPWHYPFVVLAATLPLGLLLLGLLGLWARRRAILQAFSRFFDREQSRHACRRANGEFDDTGYEALLSLNMLFLLIVFALPGTAVYDGERLFLMAYPMWGVFVVWGARSLVEHVLPVGATIFGKKGASIQGNIGLRKLGVLGFVMLQGIGILVYRPAYLSHYGLQVLGLWGAEKIGLEVTYWGDTVTGRVVDVAVRASEGAPILYAPHLAPFQTLGFSGSYAALHEVPTKLIGWGDNAPDILKQAKHCILYHRKADFEKLPDEIREGEVIYEFSKFGVWLARVVCIRGNKMPVVLESNLE